MDDEELPDTVLVTRHAKNVSHYHLPSDEGVPQCLHAYDTEASDWFERDVEHTREWRTLCRDCDPDVETRNNPDYGRTTEDVLADCGFGEGD